MTVEGGTPRPTGWAWWIDDFGCHLGPRLTTPIRFAAGRATLAIQLPSATLFLTQVFERRKGAPRVFYINVWLTVKEPENVSKVRALLAEAARLSRGEPGCAGFEVFHSEADASRFLLCERWESKPAWEVHRQGEAFTTIYQPQVLPLVNRDPHPSQLVV